MAKSSGSFIPTARIYPIGRLWLRVKADDFATFIDLPSVSKNRLFRDAS
jgi:hypothetical protein